MLLRILLLIIILLILPDLYIYLMYIRRWTCQRWLRLLWWMPSIALAISAGIIMGSGDMRPEHQPWVSMFMYCFLALCAPKALFMIVDGIGQGINKLVTGGKKDDEGYDCLFVRGVRIIGMALAIFAFSLLTYGYFWGATATSSISRLSASPTSRNSSTATASYSSPTSTSAPCAMAMRTT